MVRRSRHGGHDDVVPVTEPFVDDGRADRRASTVLDDVGRS
jgi:hypothetical protein